MSLPSIEALIQENIELVICAKPWAKELLSTLNYTDFIELNGEIIHDFTKIARHLKENPCERPLALTLPHSLTSAITFKAAKLKTAGFKAQGRSLLLSWRFNMNRQVHRVQCWYELVKKTIETWKKMGINLSSPPELNDYIPYTINPQSLQEAQLIQETYQLKDFILIAPTATGKHKGKDKNWPYYHELTQMLQAQGYTVAVSVPEKELSIAKAHAPTALFLPSIKLSTYIALTSLAKLVICNDSGVAHLCSLSQTPQLTMIGVTDPSITAPWTPHKYLMGSSQGWASAQDVYQKALTLLPPHHE
ncbi:glycosyltransferase family 9 protein [Basilea psittacipulmonis]|nr:glycosyltransferase family 9 protein [Basilea psittacipulmonis]